METIAPVFGEPRRKLRGKMERSPIPLGADAACVGASLSHRLSRIGPRRMLETVSRISQVMLQATAPAFLLGATASYIGILLSRLNMIIDRSREIHGISDDDKSRVALRADIPRLKARAVLLHNAIGYAVASSICTTLLIVWGFAVTFLGYDHEIGAGLLFITSLSLFCASLLTLARELRIGLIELDHLP